MRNYFTALTLTTIAGCSITPTVEYTKITKPTTLTEDIIDSIYLQKTEIKIKLDDSQENNQETSLPSIHISSIPSEETSFRLILKKADPFYADTNLNISKIPNTDLPKEIGTEVKDYRVDALKIAGTIITLAIAFNDNNGTIERSELPIKIDANDAMKNIGREGGKVAIENTGISITFGQVPFDARPISDLDTPLKYSGIVYSACRPAKIKFQTLVSYEETNTDGTKEQKIKTGDYEKTIKVNDPRYFQAVAFPAKGKVSYHDECGVSVTSSSDTGQSSALAITEALAAQGKAIKEAIEASKKKDEK